MAVAPITMPNAHGRHPGVQLYSCWPLEQMYFVLLALEPGHFITHAMDWAALAPAGFYVHEHYTHCPRLALPSVHRDATPLVLAASRFWCRLIMMPVGMRVIPGQSAAACFQIILRRPLAHLHGTHWFIFRRQCLPALPGHPAADSASDLLQTVLASISLLHCWCPYATSQAVHSMQSMARSLPTEVIALKPQKDVT